MGERAASLRPRYRTQPLTELQIHLSVVDLLHKCCDNTLWEWTHFPAGEKRDKQTGAKLNAMGLKPGWPDFVFIHWTRALYFLEIKRDDGELDVAQCHFHRRMRTWGIECKVARSPEEAMRILSAWGVVRIKIKGEIE